MSQKDQTYFKNPAANAAIFLNCVSPFWDIIDERAYESIRLTFSLREMGALVQKAVFTSISHFYTP